MPNPSKTVIIETLLVLIPAVILVTHIASSYSLATKLALFYSAQLFQMIFLAFFVSLSALIMSAVNLRRDPNRTREHKIILWIAGIEIFMCFYSVWQALSPLRNLSG